MHLWDDGQGIFLHKNKMKDPLLTILVEGPEKNVLVLSNEFKNMTSKQPLSQHEPYFDYVEVG